MRAAAAACLAGLIAGGASSSHRVRRKLARKAHRQIIRLQGCRSSEASHFASVLAPFAANLLAAALWIAGAPAASAVEHLPITAEAPPEDAKTASLSELLNLVEEGSVSRIDFFEEGKILVAEAQVPHADGSQEEGRILVSDILGPTSNLIAKLQRQHITIAVHHHAAVVLSQAQMILVIAIEISIPFLFLGIIAQMAGKLQERLLGKAKVQVTPKTGVSFGDVAGIDEAKGELVEIVDYLRDADRFKRVGATLPRGVLLDGKPGTGKTLLAKAVAGEAGVPFIECSGAEFIELFRGVGARRVRNIFHQAKAHSPCIVFIDEIDSIGQARRGGGGTKRQSEKEQTLLQLLTEMDGFEDNSGVLVLAATNRPESLDAALVRPGRFDRRVTIDVPSIAGRQQILTVHSANKRLAAEVDLLRWARNTTGFTGAQLANLMNEAAILAARAKATAITNEHLGAALDRVRAGILGNPLTNTASKKVLAYHEAGHAVAASFLEHHPPVEKVTILPRGQHKGSTWFEQEGEDLDMATQIALRARITAALAGRAAEHLVFGPSQVTTGAKGDLHQVEQMARAMVTQWGMSADLGSLHLGSPEQGPAYAYSEATAGSVDKEIHGITSACYEAAMATLHENRPCLDAVAEELLEHETLNGLELREIICRSSKVPPEQAQGM